MIYQCSACGSRNLEAIDTDTGEFLPEWLVDARDITGWDTDCEPRLLEWQEDKGYSDEVMEHSVDGLINSERLSGPRPKGYDSLSKALQRRVRLGYDEVKTGQNGRYPKQERRY